MGRDNPAGRPASAIERLVAACKHAVRMNWRLVLASLVATALFVLLLSSRTDWDLGGVWGSVQNLGTCLTLVVAFLVWVGDLHQQWIESLPRRLTVRFVWENEAVMVCEGAYLAGESDIRAWAQQLGAQMSDDSALRFYPDLEQTGREILHDSNEAKLFVHYTVRVKLRVLPGTLKGLKTPESGAGPLVHWKRPDFFDSRYRGTDGAPKKATSAGT